MATLIPSGATPTSPAGSTTINIIYNTGASPDRIEEQNTANEQHELQFANVPFTTYLASYAFEAYLEQSQRDRALVQVRIAGWYADVDIDLVGGVVSVLSQDARFDLSADTVANGSGWDFALTVSIAVASQTGATTAAIALAPTAALMITPSRTMGDGGIYSATANSGIIAQITRNEGIEEVEFPSVTGLSHLEGEAVSVWGDGVVLASPNNSIYTVLTVTGGTITLPAGTYTTVSVGLPFVCDIQTLDLDNGESTVKPGKFLITGVGVSVEDTLGYFAASEAPTTTTGITLPAGGSMQPCPVVDRNENAVTTPSTGFRMLTFEGRWDQSGSVFIRHLDPSPLTILALSPYGSFPR